MKHRLLLFLVLLITLSSCGGTSLDVSVPSATEWYQPRPLIRWQWQLTGTVNTSYDVYLYNIGPKDQLEYNRLITREAHQRKLSVALKNYLDQVKSLVDDIDFSINEQCFECNECDKLRPIIQNFKAVLNVEYKTDYVSKSTAQKSNMRGR